MITPTVESILEDKGRKVVYTVLAYRRLTYDEMLAAVRYFYRVRHPRSATWLRNKRITIVTEIGLEE